MFVMVKPGKSAVFHRRRVPWWSNKILLQGNPRLVGLLLLSIYYHIIDYVNGNK